METTMDWIEKTIEVQDKFKIHLRPAAKISEQASSFDGEIRVQIGEESEQREWNAKSLLDLIEFAAEFSRSSYDSFTVKVKGENSETTINELIDFIQKEISN